MPTAQGIIPPPATTDPAQIYGAGAYRHGGPLPPPPPSSSSSGSVGSIGSSVESYGMLRGGMHGSGTSPITFSDAPTTAMEFSPAPSHPHPHPHSSQYSNPNYQNPNASSLNPNGPPQNQTGVGKDGYEEVLRQSGTCGGVGASERTDFGRSEREGQGSRK